MNTGGSLGNIFTYSYLKGRIEYHLAVLGFDLVILAIMAVLLAASAIALGGHIRFFQASVLLPLLCMTAAIVLTSLKRPDTWRVEVRHILRDWVPFLFIVFIYENMHDVAGQVMDYDFAEALNRWDIAIFGVEPTIWAQNIFSPLLTDLMSISYGLYFAFPLFIMFLLSLWDMRDKFRHMALCLTLCFLLGFLGYVFLPASPPRYFIEQVYTSPVKLYGLFLFDRLQGAWDGLSVISGGAFPSLHVGISTAALIYAWRYRNLNKVCKAVWYAYIPLVLSLWFSTVYLRHHWVVDIFAGWGVALIGFFGASFLMNVWQKFRIQYGLS